MSLILCGQEAKKPLCHAKLNILIRNEQELCFLISSYPVLCMNGFISQELIEWLKDGIRREDLADTISAMIRQKESDISILNALSHGLNYLDASERDALEKRLYAIKNYKDYELSREEGIVLFKLGHLSAAGEKFSEALRLLENSLKQKGSPDEALLKNANEVHSRLLLDMALVKLRLFDESSALRLIHESIDIAPSVRGEELLYLVDKSGTLSERDKLRLDKLREEAYKKAMDSPACTQVLSIFEDGGKDTLRLAKRLASSWKKNLRRM